MLWTWKRTNLCWDTGAASSHDMGRGMALARVWPVPLRLHGGDGGGPDGRGFPAAGLRLKQRNGSLCYDALGLKTIGSVMDVPRVRWPGGL